MNLHPQDGLTASDTETVNPHDDPYFNMQGYLWPAPQGIDAMAVWERNANGRGVSFIDIESGWFIEHDELQIQPSTISGNNLEIDAGHGTAVLGIVMASDNDRGIVGAAPGAELVQLISGDDATGVFGSRVSNAIGKATDLLEPGDVLLIEVQNRYRPIEAEDHDFEAIHSAVSKGIIVIEAAGNGGMNLDYVINEKMTRSLKVGERSFKDSGAIVVGACYQDVLRGGVHGRHKASNYGSRVDCYAWGEGIVTTSTGDGDLEPAITSSSKYTKLFGGTSGASAIIAGAALLLQSLYQKNRGERLSPQNMRAALSDVTTGTGQRFNRPRDPIGVMPDLRKIIHKLGLA